MAEVRDFILEARQQTAQRVNAGLTLLYWQIGDRIQREILQEKRAEYGAEVLLSLSVELEVEFGSGFGEKNLRRMVQFAEVFPDREIVVSLIRQLTWTHFIALNAERSAALIESGEGSIIERKEPKMGPGCKKRI